LIPIGYHGHSHADMDGIEATRRIRKKNPKTRVLILTQHDNKEYILSAIKAGAAGMYRSGLWVGPGYGDKSGAQKAIRSCILRLRVL